jgi:hypothetical protein
VKLQSANQQIAFGVNHAFNVGVIVSKLSPQKTIIDKKSPPGDDDPDHPRAAAAEAR